MTADAQSNASPAWDAESNASPNWDGLGDPADQLCESNSQESLYRDPKADKATGATPGVATACRDFGISNLADAMKKYNCKPPGQ